MKYFLLPTALICICLVTALLLIQPKHVEEIDPQEPPAGHPVEQINLYHYFSGALSGGMAEMVAAVNGRDADIQVLAHALDHEAFKSMIHSTLAKDKPPEMFSYWAGAKTQALVDQGQLEPIDDIWQAIPLTKRFTTAVTETASTYNKRKYLLPITEHLVVFFYNKTLLDQEGLSVPTTWPELTNLAGKLQKRGIVPFALGAKERWPAQFWFDYLLLRSSGPEYRQALMEGRAKYTDPQVLKVYAMWGSLLQKGYFNKNANQLDWTQAAELVCSGKAAMTLMGTWAIPFLSGEKCGLREEGGFDFFAFPSISDDVPKVALGPVDGLILAKGSAGLPAAKKILGHFADIEPQKRLSEGSGAFAPNSLIPREFYSPLRQRILQESDNSPYWAFNYDLATPSDIADKGMDSFNELIAYPDRGSEILDYLQAEVEALAKNK